MKSLLLIVLILPILSLKVAFAEPDNRRFVEFMKSEGLLRENESTFCKAILEDFNTLKTQAPGSYFFRRLPSKEIYINFLDQKGGFKIAALPGDFDYPFELYQLRWPERILDLFQSWSTTVTPRPQSQLEKYSNGELLFPVHLPESSPMEAVSLITPILVRDMSLGNPSFCDLEFRSDRLNHIIEVEHLPLYCEGDPLLSVDRTFPVRGTAITFLDGEQILQNFMDRHPRLKRSQFHQSQLFHGTSSSALLAFTEYGNLSGYLMPMGQLEKAGRIPFSGEIIYGRKSLNKNHLSTTWAGEIGEALKYALSSPWTPAIGVGVLEEIDLAGNTPLNSRRINLQEVTKKRLTEWKNLNVWEKEFVSNSFPVLFGIRSNRKGAFQTPYSDIDGEIMLKDGAQSDEIRVIFVPENKIRQVHDLLARGGHGAIAVEPLELLK